MLIKNQALLHIYEFYHTGGSEKYCLLDDLIVCTVVPQLQSFGPGNFKLFKEESQRIPVSAAGSSTKANTATTQENVLDWVKHDKRRMLHVVYRVGDLDRTIKYTSFI